MTYERTVNVIGVIQRLRSSPDDGECSCDVRGSGCVRELHGITVDCVGNEVCVHARDTAFNVELTYKSCLHYELSDNVDFHAYCFFDSRSD